MKSILVTGGTGAFGKAFARHLIDHTDAKRILIYSRNEYSQFLMMKTFNEQENTRLRFMIGDVRDRTRLRRALEGVGIVVHAAALKRIEVGHYNPVEMVKTNVDGAINVIEAAQDARVEKGVFLSSDKAYQPISPYGLSKALAEAIFLAANNTTGWSGPKFSICRYGNVWNSTGSVVPTWRKMIANGATEVPVTDPGCTRFFMRMSEAVKLVTDTIETMRGGETVIPPLPSFRLGDLAKAMGVGMKIIGLPHWEKKHESMSEFLSSDKANLMPVSELKEILDETPQA